MRGWEEIVPEFDRQVYAKGGFNERQAFGQRPALVVVDVVESWTGSSRRGVLESIEEYRSACGEAAWDALPRIGELLDVCRGAGMPIVYTHGEAEEKIAVGDSTKRQKPPEEMRKEHDAPFPEMVAPQPGEFVLVKPKASAFFGTPLSTYLTQRRVDTLLVAGTSTSGCVQATVTDGYSHGYRVFVVEECVFDRSDFLHKAYLFNMNAKYGDVIALEEAMRYVRNLRGDKVVAGV